MKRNAQAIGALALGGTLAAPLLFVLGVVNLPPAQWGMLVGTIAWFIAAGNAALAPPAPAS